MTASMSAVCSSTLCRALSDCSHGHALLQVVAPNLRAFLYTWGAGRVTGEGEHIPVRMEPLQISDPNDLLLLLPVTAEHTIDERSPLFGHTNESLTVRPCSCTLFTAWCPIWS